MSKRKGKTIQEPSKKLPDLSSEIDELKKQLEIEAALERVRVRANTMEHNYARTEIGPSTTIHPANYTLEKVVLNRTIYQINNGAAGAPYYAQDETPWTPFVSGFTTQNALVFFHVDGKKLNMEVVNPDTLEKFDEMEMR